MLSILVCHSYYLRLDQKQVSRAKPYPPLATLQVVTLLRQAGHRVSFFDAMLADGIDEYDVLLRTGQPQLVLFYEDNFNAAVPPVVAGHAPGIAAIGRVQRNEREPVQGRMNCECGCGQNTAL
jgi:hypothetical protein